MQGDMECATEKRLVVGQMSSSPIPQDYQFIAMRSQALGFLLSQTSSPN